MLSTISNIASRRDLLFELVRSEMRATTAESRLGWVWWLLDPLVMMGIYWLIMVILFGREAYAPYPIFVGCALLSWKHFSTSSSRAVSVLRSNHSLIKSVPFPTAVLPLSGVLTQFMYLLFGLTALVIVALLMGLSVTPKIVQFIPLLLLQLTLTSGVAMALASFGVLLRDLETVINHVLRAGWYLSPGMYGIDLIANRMETHPNGTLIYNLYMSNPFAILFTGYRGAIHDPAWLEPRYWAVLTVQAVVCLVVGYMIYQHFDRRVIKFI